MRGDHLDHLVFVLGESRAEVLRGSEVARPPFTLGERLVGDVAHEVLEESVLPVLGRARICLNAQHLLAHEGDEQRLDVGVGTGQRRERVSA